MILNCSAGAACETSSTAASSSASASVGRPVRSSSRPRWQQMSAVTPGNRTPGSDRVRFRQHGEAGLDPLLLGRRQRQAQQDARGGLVASLLLGLRGRCRGVGIRLAASIEMQRIQSAYEDRPRLAQLPDVAELDPRRWSWRAAVNSWSSAPSVTGSFFPGSGSLPEALLAGTDSTRAEIEFQLGECGCGTVPPWPPWLTSAMSVSSRHWAIAPARTGAANDVPLQVPKPV